MLDMLLRTVSPERFAVAYGATSYIDGQLVCDFGPIGKYRVHAGGFVYIGPEASGVQTANIVDIKAMLRRCTDSDTSWGVIYRESIGAIMKKFSVIVPANFKNVANLNLMADQALKRRRLVNAITCAPTDPATLPGPVSIMLARRFGLKSLNDYVVYVPKSKVQVLSQRCASLLGKKVKLKNEDALVVPYYSWVSDIAALEFHYVRGDVRTLWLNESKAAFAAINKLSDENSIVEDNIADATRDQSASAASGCSYTTAIINPAGGALLWVPLRLYYVCRTPDVVSLLKPAQLASLGSDVHITTTPFMMHESDKLPLTYAVVGAIVDNLRKYRFVTLEVSVLMSAVPNPEEVREAVITELTELGEHTLCESFKNSTRGGAIWATSSGKMYSTDSGYLWEDDSNADMHGELVTNYIIEPKLSVSYETGDVYRRMVVHIGDDERTVDVPAGALDTPKKLTETINDVISLSGKPTHVTAAVYDQTRARAVVLWATKMFSELPVNKGTSYLGWSPTSTKYVTPSFTLQKVGDDVVELPGVWLRPGIDYFKYFSGEVQKEDGCTFAIEEGYLLNLVYQIAAMILRTYSGHPVSPIEYSGDYDTRTAVARVFSKVAQVELLQLNKNMRAVSQLDVLNGWPYAAQGYNRSQAKACEAAMILLGEEGPRLKYNDTELDKAADAIAWIVREVPRYLMKNSGPNFLPAADAIDSVVTAAEGRSILEEVFNSVGVDVDLPPVTYETDKVIL